MVFLIGALGAGVAFATTRPAAPLAPGTARLVPGDAAVTVHRGSPIAAADAPLRSGDELTVERGVAVVQTATGTITARSGTTITFDGASPRVERGDALIDGHEMSVGAPAAQILVDGVTRIGQQLSLEVGVYEGTAVVSTATDSRVVGALRRAVVAGLGGSTSTTVLPLALDPTDAWDRRLLGDALELDAVLAARSRGLTLQIASAAPEVRDRVLAVVSSAWTTLAPLNIDVPVGEVVVAAELARAAHLDAGAVARALTLRSEGASWGVIAVGQGVRTLPATFAEIDADVVPAGAAIVRTSSIPVVSRGSTLPVMVSPIVAPVPTPTVAAPPVGTSSPEPVVVPPVPPENGVQGVVNVVGSLLHGLLG